MREIQPYKVEVIATVRYQLIVDARTPEEAESTAEQILESDLADADVLEQVIESIEALPLEE